MRSGIWYVYLVECSDASIYTGITTNIEKRIIAHNSGKGAKYTRVRIPVMLKAYWEYPDKSSASKAEYQIKKMTRKQKLEKIISFELPVKK